MSAPATPTQRPPASAPLYLAGFLSFLLLGLMQASYGPAFGALRSHFGLDAAQVGAVTGMHFAGATVGPLLLAYLLRFLPQRTLLLLGAACCVVGMLGVALSPAWGLVLASAAVVGLGYGFLSAGFNSAFALLGTGAANLLNALFGVGSVAAPLLGLAVGTYPTPFLLLAGLMLLAALSIWPARWPQQASEVAHTPLDWRKMAAFGALFFWYVGFESGVGSWVASYVQALHQPNAAWLTSLYWLSLTVGRFLAASLGKRLTSEQLVLGAAVGCLASAIILSIPALLPLALLLAGLSAAPIFPTALAWFARLHPAQATPYMLTIGALASATVPVALGWLLKWQVAALPWGVAADAALLLLAVLLAWRQERHNAAALMV